MAFTRNTLSGNIGVGSAAPTMYTYGTADAKATVIAAGYFLGAYNTVKVGDFILANCSNASVMLVVLTATSSAFTVGYVAVA